MYILFTIYMLYHYFINSNRKILIIQSKLPFKKLGILVIKGMLMYILFTIYMLYHHYFINSNRKILIIQLNYHLNN